MKCLSILSLSLYTLCAFSTVAHAASPVAQPAASASDPSNAVNKSPTLSGDINQRRTQLLNQLKQTPVPAGAYAELVKTYIELEQKVQELRCDLSPLLFQKTSNDKLHKLKTRFYYSVAYFDW